MAQSLSRIGAIDTLEDAVHLLRRAPAGMLIGHFAGSAPFALGVLFYWNAITNPRTSGATCIVESLALAMLLIWMNCFRAVFASRLRNLLSGSSDPSWSGVRLWNILADQSLLGATRLLAIPFAVLILFPLADAVAFYRYATAVPVAKARKLAHVDTAQNWTILMIVQFLWLLVALNVGVALAALPQLARILTGYESGFSRSGVYYILNPLFFMMTLMVTWMVFDPFVQAVYTVRCFRLESLETGEDLRVGIRRIRSAATRVAAVLLLAILPASAIPREKLRESIEHVMQSPEYDWRLPPDSRQAAKPWLVEATDRMVAHLREFFAAIGRGIQKIIRWLERQLQGDIAPPAGGSPPRSLPWNIYMLTAAALAAAAWLAWRAWSRPREPLPRPHESSAIVLDAEDLSAARLPEAQWLELAGQCLREGDYRLALRAFYLANLAWLGQRDFLSLDAGKTNREYYKELHRRSRESPEARTLFSTNIAVFERGWYGARGVSNQDVAEFQQRVSEMKRLMQAAAEKAA